MPIQRTIAMPASIGIAHAIQASVPVRQIVVTKAPFRIEYPARAPSAFHPGCPM